MRRKNPQIMQRFAKKQFLFKDFKDDMILNF